MTTCETLRQDAAGLASLPSGDPERDAAYAHARTCPGCARALGEGERLLGLLDALPHPALDRSAARRASRAVLDQLTGAPSLLLPAMAVAAAALWVVSARAPSHGLGRWLAGGALVLAAAGLAALARRGLPAVAAAVAASALAVLLDLGPGGPGALSPAVGWTCLATELGAASLPLIAAAASWRRGPRAAGPLAAAAAAGALAGQAALLVTCHAPGSLPHALVFHTAGVALAAILGASAGLALRAERA